MLTCLSELAFLFLYLQGIAFVFFICLAFPGRRLLATSFRNRSKSSSNVQLVAFTRYTQASVGGSEIVSFFFNQPEPIQGGLDLSLGYRLRIRYAKLLKNNVHVLFMFFVFFLAAKCR